jgi:hypothetical protein
MIDCPAYDSRCHGESAAINRSLDIPLPDFAHIDEISFRGIVANEFQYDQTR